MQFLRNLLDKVEPNFEKGGKLEKLYPLYDAIDTICGYISFEYWCVVDLNGDNYYLLS